MIIFLISHQNHMLWPSSEPSYRDGSYEGSQHMVLGRINKNYSFFTIFVPSFRIRTR